MIRQANKYDKTELIDFMRQYRNESEIPAYKNLENVEYINNLIDSILAGKGVSYIAPNKGMIIGLIAPVIWSDKIFALHELVWWVKPEYRNGMTGYRLLKAYLNDANKLKQENRIKFFTLSKLPNTPNLDYAKLGFRKSDENWVQ